MGLGLQLLPLCDEKACFSSQIISLERNYYLFDKIKAKVKEVGVTLISPINTFLAHDEKGEYCFGKIDCDAYDKKLTYLLAKDLKQVFSGFEFAKDTDSDSWENRAAKAFVNELPDDLPIYLYWC